MNCNKREGGSKRERKENEGRGKSSKHVVSFRILS